MPLRARGRGQPQHAGGAADGERREADRGRLGAEQRGGRGDGARPGDRGDVVRGPVERERAPRPVGDDARERGAHPAGHERTGAARERDEGDAHRVGHVAERQRGRREHSTQHQRRQREQDAAVPRSVQQRAGRRAGDDVRQPRRREQRPGERGIAARRRDEER
jgi:hypothetical protein